MQINKGKIELIKDNEVFVFGSNANGFHLAGAAKDAMQNYGAKYGQGHGLQGRSYAIDTMSGIDVIEDEVKKFITFAEDNPDKQFILTPIGCGIAGYDAQDIAPLFDSVPSNVVLPKEFIGETNDI